MAGPVEYLVIAFPGSRFAGSVAPVLADAASSGAVRAADLAFVRRGEGGALTPVELRELDPEGVVPADAAEGGAAVLGAEDVERLDRGVPAGDVVAIVVREDLWTTPLARAAREVGGTFVAHERLGSGGPGDQEVAGDDDIITRLERLAELWKREILTDAEFVEQKEKLLSD